MTTAYTLISAVQTVRVADLDVVEISGPDSPIDYRDLPADAKAWAKEQGYDLPDGDTTDNPELLYVVSGEHEIAGFPTRTIHVEAEDLCIHCGTARVIQPGNRCAICIKLG